MGLFGKKGPKLHTCRICSELVPDEKQAKQDHYVSHLIEVTDNNGHKAYTFKCPKCGLMDSAWGGGRSDPVMIGHAAILSHFMQSHSDMSVM